MLDKNLLKPYLCVPKLIEQPTWGADYILEFKNWSNKKEFQGVKIGQSYEFFSGTKLAEEITSSDDERFTGDLGWAMKPDEIDSKFKSEYISLKDLIGHDPEGVLGQKVIEKYGKMMPLLLKFTQAKGNSFQIHAQKEAKHWQPKPESWYYFEPGILTLGVKKGIDWDEYKNLCLMIEKKMQELSEKVTNNKMALEDARQKAKKFIQENNPLDFVNYHEVEKEALVDLSPCGIHHSWEEDEEKFPLGNVLYEIQLDKMDPISVIRCFDRGKIKSDGSLRKIHIEDYFLYIDRSEEANDIENAQVKSEVLLENKNGQVERILENKHYGLEKLTLLDKMTNEFTKTRGRFHHLFVKEGEVEVLAGDSSIFVSKGHSVFIPAGLKEYEIQVKNNSKAEILKSFC